MWPASYLWTLGVSAWLLGLGAALQAHPALRAAPDHPVVADFERFHLPGDSPESLAQGGLLLIAELNCTACHEAPAAWASRLQSHGGPDLSDLASRMTREELWHWIRSPQHFKPGTTMPTLLSEEPQADQLALDIASWLSEGSAAKPETRQSGDSSKGRALYHRIGCVACHEPGSDAELPANLSPTTTTTPASASVPIALAHAYTHEALANFLRTPLKTRPAGRMPALNLSPSEAADLAAYLKTDTEARPLNPFAKLQLQTPRPERGALAFQKLSCAQCHPLKSLRTVKQQAKPLAALGGGGCLTPSAATGAPRFALSALQTQAIELALPLLRSATPEPGKRDQIQWIMNRLNCHACHDRHDKGGPEEGREVHFTALDPAAESLGELGKLPPSLSNTGRKLTAQWLEKLLIEGSGQLRPYLATRMPQFHVGLSTELIKLWPGSDPAPKPVSIDVSGLEKHHRAELGRQLMGTSGLSCVGCHGLKDRKSLGPPVMALTFTTQRLQAAYFKELLLNPQATQPGTLMPPMFMARKNSDKEIESIWTYLRELQAQPLPPGLLLEGDFELKPDKEGRTLVLRSFIEGVGTHAIGVGFPGGLNLAYDANHARVTLLWKGRFLDALNNWQSREMPPIKPLGTDLKTLPVLEGTRQHEGYRLDAKGNPTFLFRDQHGSRLEESWLPTPDGKGLQRTLRISGQPQATTEVVSW